MTGASEILRGGVIAAGHGTRLRADGYRASKPMALVGGRPLIEHTLDRFRAAGIRRVTVIVNEESDDCRQWLSGHGEGLDLDLIVRTTPSSYASFELVAARLAHSPALITTVDSILPVDDFRHFVRSAAAFPGDAVVLGLTGHVDDDNPLWATLRAADGRILRLGGDSGSHVTAGLYWLPPDPIAKPAMQLRPAPRLSQMAGRPEPAGLWRRPAAGVRHRSRDRCRGGRIGGIPQSA